MKKTMMIIVGLAVLGVGFVFLNRTLEAGPPNTDHLTKLNPDTTDWKKKDDSYWQKQLTPLQYRVCRKGGTERAFSGHLLHNKKTGTYFCSSCGQKLFVSSTKFKSGTGWPSFYRAKKGKVGYRVDKSYGMTRTEIVCTRCGAHLGHRFDDGPKPTGKRYCVNSVCLGFLPDKPKSK